jgi:hypothetical protein
MVKALECPSCGARHRLDGLEPSMSFRCEQCGQSLKVPSSLAAAQEGVATTSTSTVAASGSTAVAPPPRRRDAGSARARDLVSASATIAATDTAVDGDARGPRKPQKSKGGASKTNSASSGRSHWYWRLLAWVVALPLALLLTAWPAYQLDLISKDDLLDVFVGEGSGRYTTLAILTVVWALVTAVIVQLLIEGGRWWSRRRKANGQRAEPVRRADAPG